MGYPLPCLLATLGSFVLVLLYALFGDYDASWNDSSAIVLAYASAILFPISTYRFWKSWMKRHKKDNIRSMSDTLLHGTTLAFSLLTSWELCPNDGYF